MEGAGDPLAERPQGTESLEPDLPQAESFMRFELQLAQLSGSLKGYAEEVRTQARRMDGLESRLADWRRCQDEAMTSRLLDVQKSILKATQTALTAEKLASEQVRDLRRLEGKLEDQLGHESGASGKPLLARLTELEFHLPQLARSISAAKAEAPRQEPTPLQTPRTPRVVSPEEVKIEVLKAEVTSLQARSEEQGVRLAAFGLRLDAQLESLRQLEGKLEAADYGGALEKLQQALRRESSDRAASDSKLTQSHRDSEHALEELKKDLRSVQNQCDKLALGVTSADSGEGSSHKEGALERAEELALNILIHREAERVTQESLRNLRQELDTGVHERRGPGSVAAELHEEFEKLLERLHSCEDSVKSLAEQRPVKAEKGPGTVLAIPKLAIHTEESAVVKEVAPGAREKSKGLALSPKAANFSIEISESNERRKAFGQNRRHSVGVMEEVLLRPSYEPARPVKSETSSKNMSRELEGLSITVLREEEEMDHVWGDHTVSPGVTPRFC